MICIRLECKKNKDRTGKKQRKVVRKTIVSWHYMGSNSETPWNPSDHHNTIILTGLRSLPNWYPIMPRDSSLSNCFLLRIPSRLWGPPILPSSTATLHVAWWPFERLSLCVLGPKDTWSQMNQKHDTDTNSASSSVLFALLLRYYTVHTTHLTSCQMKLTRRLNGVSVSCTRYIWLQVSLGRKLWRNSTIPSQQEASECLFFLSSAD